MSYDAHLPALSLWDGENSYIILAGKVLSTVQGYILCKNWHLCGLCWDDCERKNSHVPTSSDVESTLTRMVKIARREQRLRLQPSNDRMTSPLKPPSYLNL